MKIRLLKKFRKEFEKSLRLEPIFGLGNFYVRIYYPGDHCSLEFFCRQSCDLENFIDTIKSQNYNNIYRCYNEMMNSSVEQLKEIYYNFMESKIRFYKSHYSYKYIGFKIYLIKAKKR